MDKRRLFTAGTFPYLEDFSVGVKHIYGHLDVLLNAFPSPLKISSLQCQVQVVTDVTWTSRDMLMQTNMSQTPAHMVVLFVKMQQRCKHVRNLKAGAVCRTHFKLTHIRLTTCVDVCGLIYHSPLVLIEEVSPLMYKDGS